MLRLHAGLHAFDVRSFDFVMQHLEWYCYYCGEIAEGVFVVVLAAGPDLEIGHHRARDFPYASNPC